MTFLKINLLAIYALAVLSLWLPLPWQSGPVLQNIAMALLAIHAIETIFAFKHVKTYPGPLGKSMALSLLFGLLHWLPLARRAKQAALIAKDQ
jgi:hypothetical protein